MHGDLDGLKPLQLFRDERGNELCQESLLRLRHLLLQRVDLDYYGSDLRRVSAGTQHDSQLLGQSLCVLEKRH